MLIKDEQSRKCLREGRRREQKYREMLEVTTTTTGAWKTLRPIAFEKLRRLECDDDTDYIKEKGQGVFGMKFIQDARACDARCVAEAADDLRGAIAWLGGSVEDACGREVVATGAGDTVS
jgi:hypothetical protein